MHATVRISEPVLCLAAAVVFACAAHAVATPAASPAPKVDFSYAFATPHRMTIGRPDASDRTLLDLQPGSLRLAWTYDNLTLPNYPPLSFRTPPTMWSIVVTPQVEGHTFARSRWTRVEGVLPALENVYDDPLGSLRLEAVGGPTAAIIRIDMANQDSKPHQVLLRCDSGNWGENPAWLEPGHYVGDNLVAGWNDRADRVLILGIGGDAYSLQPDGSPPGPRNLLLVCNLKAGEKRTAWLVRPYHGYASHLPTLRKHNWAQEMEHGKREWRDLLGRASRVTIPDPGVANAYLACLGDLFIMREPFSNGQIGGVPGTEVYRAGNSGEAAIVAVALDQNGYHREAADGFQVSLDMQEADGNWDDYKGWGHSMWVFSGLKSWVIMEHYRLTGDKSYLTRLYPRMLASSRWQEQQRARSRKLVNGERPLTYGLMARGFGDCGLMNDGDMYGIFIPHNIWAVYADRCSWEAAEILGKSQDLAELEKVYKTGRADLLAAIERGAIRQQDYRWIPGVPGKTSGSRWGVLNIAFPCELLPPEHELVTGTLRYIESNMSPGGIPVHTGWLKDGMWVAITLDNVAEVHLQRGNGDAAVRYLYATLNHGTPLYTWCEERGQEAGSTHCTGDRQHLWTPVAVVRAIRDMLVMESGNGLNLALGTDRSWLASGKPVGIAAAATHFGLVSYRMRYAPTKSQVSGEAAFADNATAAWSVLYIRLPGGLKVKSVNPESKATVLPNGSGIRWAAPHGTLKFRATIGS